MPPSAAPLSRPSASKRRTDWTRPQILHVETPHGEATLILDCGCVAYASPSMAWALGWPIGTLAQRLRLLGWIATIPRRNTYPLALPDPP
jgi:hypothetical protein